MDKNTTRHSELSEESSITRYKTENVIANVAWQSRHYVINSFRKLAYGKGLIWILRFAQNDGWVKTLDYIITGLSRKVNLARNDGYARKLGFTMAEILLSLTIIGVVAAITLPSLTGNINEKTWNTQRRAFYARMSQAIALMGSLNGYGLSGDSDQTISNAAKIFVTDGLSKVLKINNICDYEHLQDCGLSTKITTIAGSKIYLPTNFYTIITTEPEAQAGLSSFGLYKTKPAAFETVNGESVAVYYNPICSGQSSDINKYVGSSDDAIGDGGNTIQYLCVNFVFDMNGKKGPNTVGKDISTVSVFFPIDSQVANAQPKVNYLGWKNYDNAVKACKNLGEDYRLPTIQEWMSMYASSRLFDFESGSTNRYWSITPYSDTAAWTMYSSFGIRRIFGKSNIFQVRCVKR